MHSKKSEIKYTMNIELLFLEFVTVKVTDLNPEKFIKDVLPLGLTG